MCAHTRHCTAVLYTVHCTLYTPPPQSGARAHGGNTAISGLTLQHCSVDVGAAGAADTEHPCTDTQLTYLFEDDFDIDEEEDNHGDEEEDEEDDTLLSDDDEESDRGSVVGEETDFNNKIEDIIDEYNSDQFEILDS